MRCEYCGRRLDEDNYESHCSSSVCRRAAEKEQAARTNSVKYVQKLEAENKTLSEIIDSYRTQYKAAMKAQSLGLCKRAIKHALEDEQALRPKGRQ